MNRWQATIRYHDTGEEVTVWDTSYIGLIAQLSDPTQDKWSNFIQDGSADMVIWYGELAQ